MSQETIQQNEQKENTCSFKKLAILVIISLIISIASLVTSTYVLVNNASSTGKKVVISKQYDKGKSYKKAQDTKKPMIVFFYTDWCGYCQRFVPTYHKLSKDKEIKKNFAIAYVNCEDQKNRELINEYQIQGFPTVFAIDKEGKRTQIDNRILFASDAIKSIKEEALKAIN